MCLSIIDKRHRKIKESWKVFDDFDGELSGIFYTLKKAYPENKWIEDPSIGLVWSYKYKTGFHFFFTKEDAEDYVCDLNNSFGYEGSERHFVIRKIKVAGITATGKDSVGRSVGVARKIKILKEETQ